MNEPLTLTEGKDIGVARYFRERSLKVAVIVIGSSRESFPVVNGRYVSNRARRSTVALHRQLLHGN